MLIDMTLQPVFNLNNDESPMQGKALGILHDDEQFDNYP